ncbi:DUF3300 domain-containing protein [Humisphaera borealis]|uniref:DUF3300 domain-containing protein n=1 Tax=Humisphaera borealis TaxID=2807512 RepID=A0A7M2WVB8_9BACT|nr:DUF3300 domain-containing protein [Humisphaera borealis]QOV89478.1 DUF3300 domain-containing protein [Humisphaera borealis]
MRLVTCLFALLVLVGPAVVRAQAPAAPASPPAAPTFKPEELEQILAPIALYPDDLLAQTLMAATYPLEVVQAQRWADANKALTGDTLAKELEKQTWDPSVRSLVNFPDVLKMMSEKLDWTVKLGDAFLAQQKDVMDTVQKLRAKAQAAGNLKTTEQQKVTTAPAAAGTTQTIIIQPAQPQVVYVPVYNPTVVYGVWAYPAYPPYYYYPPYYRPSPGISFGVGLAVGVAWGYAWGNCNWGRNDIDIDINRNVNINTNINRNQYKADFNKTNVNVGSNNSSWQHNPTHRQGTPYRDTTSAQKYGRPASPSRDAYRGYSSPSGAGFAPGAGSADRGYQPATPRDVSRPQPAAVDRTGSTFDRSGSTYDRSTPAATRTPSAAEQSGSRGSAFQGVDRGAASTRSQSSRGSSSRGSAASHGGRGR